MVNIIGSNGNDTLFGSDDADTINGKAGDDIITSYSGDNTLIGGGGNDKFVYLYDGNDIITDFGGIGKGVNPSAEVIAEVDTLSFQGLQCNQRTDSSIGYWFWWWVVNTFTFSESLYSGNICNDKQSTIYL
jgi:Ca2+-binding RTX toxin-like protein